MPPLEKQIQQQLVPSEDQWFTIYLIIGYTVGILILWNVPYLKEILYPFKLVTVALHEFGHASAGWLTGAKIKSIEVNPNEGGVTHMYGGNPYCTLPAGYLGSAFWGAVMILSGFNLLASKIVAGIVGVALLITLFYASNGLTRCLTLLFIGCIVGLFFLYDGIGLRYFVLFFGVMSCMYSLWDIVDDTVRRRVNESDAVKFSKLCCHGMISPRIWGLLWFIISLAFMTAAIVLGLLIFKTQS